MFDQYDEEPSKFLTENDVVECRGPSCQKRLDDRIVLRYVESRH